MATMNALRLHTAGRAQALQYEPAPRPTLRPGDLLVAVGAAAITPGELGWGATTHDLPRVPSHEFAGRVVDGVGDTGDVQHGERIYALGDFDLDGAAAEYVAVAASDVARAPATVDDVHAAAIPLSGLTAWQALFDHGHVGPGDEVLVHGAAGGVGSFAVQLAHAAGARVTAVTSARHADTVRSFGADEVVDRNATRFEDVTGGVDVVLDTVGGTTLERSWRVLAPSGTIVSIVAQPAPPPDMEPGGRSGTFFIVRPSRDELDALARLVDDARLRPLVGATFPLASGREAFERLETVPGKAVLVVGAD